MQWAEFIEKLADAKKRKVKGLNIPTIANLLFGGAMDSMLPPGTEITIEMYKGLFEEAKKALKSKASLAKKRKTELIGLGEVNGPVSLSLWRHQMNPLSHFDIISSCKENLKMYGFEDTKHAAYPMKRRASETYRTPALLTPYWGKVFQNKIALDAFEAGEYELAILGVITSATVRPYADGTKDRLVFQLFTGTEHTDDIIVWPDRQGKIPEAITNSIRPLELGFAIVRPKTWNGRAGATLVKWHKITR